MVLMSASDPKRTLAEPTRVQIKRQLACMATPMEEEQPERPMSVVPAHIVGEPNHRSHVLSNVGEIVDGVANHRCILVARRAARV